MQERSFRDITLGMVNGIPIVLLVRRWELSANLLHFKKSCWRWQGMPTTLLFPLPEGPAHHLQQ